MLQSNPIKHVFSAKHWLLDGWGIYRQAPVSWTFMILLFSIAYIVAMNSLPGKAIAALLTPVFLGGIYVAAFKADNGESIAMENLFSMFKDRQRLKQLLTIGGIGVAVVVLTYIFENMPGSDYAMRAEAGGGIGHTATTLGKTLSKAIFWIWGLATIFSIPLVAITNQGAIESIKNSIFTALFNIIPIFTFFACALLLTILGAIPFGLGIFVVIPTLFCSMYFIFKMVYLKDIEPVAAASNNVSTPLAAGVGAESTPGLALNSAQGLLQKSSQNIGEALVERIYEAQDKYDPQDRTDTKQPPGFTVNHFDDYVQITRKWMNFQIVGMLISAVIWNSVWIFNDFAGILASDREWLLKLFCVVYIVAGAAFVYCAIATALNKTEVYVNKNHIVVLIHPIPWPGKKTIDAKSIKQIYVKTTYKRRNGRTYSQHHVTGLTLDDQNIKLVSGLKDFHQAHFIEKNIEEYLGIKDQEVAGENRRPPRKEHLERERDPRNAS